ncbi:shikimate kinase AroK [Carnimonas bestiolae]|uniref:shikimate kinase AroK n=1 Tax=Carnimonas bestiolae TaxID=3402172 RepID=UPI003EDCAE55
MSSDVMQDAPNIFLVGPMGTGKSTIGRLLAAELGRPFVDSDHEIEQRCGCNIPWIFDLEGESGFRQREAAVIDELTGQPGIVLATGGGAITHPRSRELLHQRGLVIFLKTSVAHQLKRTARDRNRPLLQCVDPAAKLRQLMHEREPLYREAAHVIINTERRGPKGVVMEIKRQIEQRERSPV